jgi:acyl carrier protein
MTEWLNERVPLIVVFTALILVSTAYVAYLASQRNIKRRVLDELYEDRVLIDSNEYYSMYFTDTDVPQDLIKQILETLNYEEPNVEFTRISPDKDFLKELSKIDFFDLSDAFISLEQKFDLKFSPQDYESFISLRQIAHTIRRKSPWYS